MQYIKHNYPKTFIVCNLFIPVTTTGCECGYWIRKRGRGFTFLYSNVFPLTAAEISKSMCTS